MTIGSRIGGLPRMRGDRPSVTSAKIVDGYNVNARLVYEGLALAYRKYSKKYVPEENKARAAKRGLWAGEFIPPWDWRKGKRLGQKKSPIACCKICKKARLVGILVSKRPITALN